MENIDKCYLGINKAQATTKPECERCRFVYLDDRECIFFTNYERGTLHRFIKELINDDATNGTDYANKLTEFLGRPAPAIYGAYGDGRYNMDDWYEIIEPEIRGVVNLLRNKGFNTISSCGHGMWVEMETYSTLDIDRLYTILLDNGYEGFRISYHWDTYPIPRRYLRVDLEGKRDGVMTTRSVELSEDEAVQLMQMAEQAHRHGFTSGLAYGAVLRIRQLFWPGVPQWWENEIVDIAERDIDDDIKRTEE